MVDCERELRWTTLMQLAVAGDAQAYHELLEDLARALRATVRRGLAQAGRGPDEAEDVVQETLLAIHLKRHTWESTKPLGPWVRAIARNKLIDALRRRGAHLEVPIEAAPESALGVASEVPLPQRDLDRLLGELSTRQRDIVRSISLDGRSIRATATRLAMTEGAVRVALHRSLKQLAAIYRRIGP